MDPVSKPLPKITPDWEPFFAAARHERLVLQRCRGCAEFRFPPRPVCPRCWSTDAAWEDVSGYGEVWSYVVMHQVYHPAFAAEVPYAVVQVRLREGPKMLSRLLGVAPAEIRIGLPVRVEFRAESPEITLPYFCPAAAGSHGGGD